MNNVIDMPLSVAGRFKIEANKLGENGEVVSTRIAADWFSNLITNQGLDLMGTGSIDQIVDRCRVGSGSTPPAVTDTALVAQVATVLSPSKTWGFTTSAPYYNWFRMVYTFPVGAAAGNLSEVGIGSSGANLLSRALIVDGTGTPTTITILADEQLVVTYEFRIYNLVDDVPFSIVISGVTYTGTVRPARVGAEQLVGGSATAGGVGGQTVGTTGSALGAFTALPTSQVANSGTISNLSYTNGNYYRDFTITWSPSQGNVGSGITTMVVSHSMGKMQISFSPIIPKTNTKTLVLTFRQGPWSRFTP